MPEYTIRPLNPEDAEWVAHFIEEQWHSPIAISRGKIYYPHTLPGFVALQDDKPVGLITYTIQDHDCEIVTIDSIFPSHGTGTALIQAVKEVAEQHQCSRLWLITTNDNLNALRFYQKRGFTLVALHRNALEQSRKLKPEIPLMGKDGIPLRDEIELEMLLVHGG